MAHFFISRIICTRRVEGVSVMDASTLLNRISATLPENIDDEVAERLLHTVSAFCSPDINSLQGIGEVIHTPQMVEMLGISRQAVHKAMRCGRVVAVPDGRRWAYPLWQISDIGTILDGVPAVQARLHGRVDELRSARWWVRKLGKLDGISPAEWLRTGRDLTRVVAAAEQFAVNATKSRG